MSSHATWRSSAGFVIFVVSTAVFTDVLFYGLTIPFLPIVLRDRIHVPASQVQAWNSALLAVYGGANFFASPICGILADRSRSRQLPLLIGLLVMTVGTLFLQFGTSIIAMIVARLLQGLAAALLYSAGMALLCDTLGKNNLGYAMGYVTLAITAASFVGPSLGGTLYYSGGEIAVFIVAYSVIAVDLVMRLAVVEKSKAVTESHVEDDQSATQPLLSHNAGHSDRTETPLSPNSDLANTNSQLTSEPSVADGSKPLLAGNPANGYGTQVTQPQNTCSASASGHQTEAKKSNSMIRLLSMPRLLVPLYGWLSLGIFLSAFDSTLPIFVTSTLSWSVAGAGLVFLPLFIPNLAGPLYGHIVDSHPRAPRIVATIGFLISVPPCVLLLLINSDARATQWLFCGLLLCIGFGLALSGPPLMVEIFSAAQDMENENPDAFGDKGLVAQAYGLYSSALAAGQLAGPVLSSLMIQNFGWTGLSVAFGVLGVVTGVIMALFLGEPLWSSRTSKEQCDA